MGVGEAIVAEMDEAVTEGVAVAGRKGFEKALRKDVVGVFSEG